MSSRPPIEGRRPIRDSALHGQLADGAVRQHDGQRVAVVPLEFLSDLRDAVAPDFGPSARHLFYCTGYDWSLRDMVRLGQRLRDELGSGNLDLWQMDAKFVLDSWWTPLAAAGWGACTFAALPRGFVLAEVTSSATAAAQRERATPAPEPACDLYAGLLAGALSFFERAERHAVEIQCAALGHPTCLFIAGGSPHIEKIETWRQQNLSAAEIRQRLAALPDAPAA